ncbi:sigma 54-interacting transcriptional regulator [Myxococcota bacterium]|nr:sigma 54-interacting transcriptional regulator [Myxococcota bacterium]
MPQDRKTDSNGRFVVDERSTADGTLEGVPSEFWRSHQDQRLALALAIIWSREEPHRIGEVAFVEEERILGRGGDTQGEAAPKVRFMRQRPGSAVLGPPIESVKISRVQLRLRPEAGGVRVESVGRSRLFVDGIQVEGGITRVGSTIRLGNELMLLVVERPTQLPQLRSFPDSIRFEFGRADPFGYVGESPAAWRLRDAVAFAAKADGHVLVRGESGTGKELVAAAVHKLSTRGDRPMISRNAATFPEGLVDAELFGNLKNYPTPGLSERDGVIGEANNSTLFLDEIGELPLALQAHLLRVLDRGGEYQRLGDSRVRRADLRVVAATNRPIEALKHDFAARLTQRIEVPPLADRREDIPLLVAHLLELAASSNPHVAQAFFAPGLTGRATARVDPELVDRLVRHPFSTHTRELNQLLWQALGDSSGNYVALTDGVRAAMDRAIEKSQPPTPVRRLESVAPAEELETDDGEDDVEPTSITKEQIETSLTRAGGNVTKAARELGLKNRFVLYRLMKKLGVSGQAE